jgi:GNAT superfamily N-acetyltransferase
MSDIKLFTANYKDCKNDLIHFRNSNRDTERDEAYFDWRYLRRPNGLDPIIVWAENGEGRKIGALSLIPHHYMVNNSAALVGVLGDISVAKDWRGKGIAHRMFSYLSETEAVRKLSASLVLPNEAASGPLAKANWQTISTMERHVKFFKVEKKFLQLFRVSWLSKLAAFPFNMLLKVLSLETYAHAVDGYNGMIVSEFDDRFDALWNDAEKEGMCIGTRNKHYLTWRYANHPLIHYRIFTLTHHSMLCGYIIFHYSEDTCYIDDIFFIDKNRYPYYLLVFYLKHIRTTDSSKIIFSMNNNDFFNLKLLKFGFIKRPSNWSSMILIHDIKAEAFLLEGNNWFLTAGDKDA